ncbi:MAG: sulfotransferase [Desulfobacteraceae bacterium]|nr:sulfotransferase [Desulfobacteraceae bacterium]
MEKILSPSEINKLIQQIRTEVEQKPVSLSELTAIQQSFENFIARWETAYSRFGQNPSGELAYRDVILYFTEDVLPKIRKHLSEKGPDKNAADAVEFMLFPGEKMRQRLLPPNWRRFRQVRHLPGEFECPEFERPVFIVSAPRAGSTLLFETLSKFDRVWTIGFENHDIETDIPYLHPETRNYESNRLTDAPPDVAAAVKHWFARQLRNRAGKLFLNTEENERPKATRFLEKTPKNAFRIPFLKKVFPDALFIFLYRDPQENISSMLEGWRSKRFLAYRDMPGWPYREWRFLLPPNWQTLAECPLAEIAAYQWNAANQYILDDLAALPRHEWCFVTYKSLVEQPAEAIRRISSFAGLEWDEQAEVSVSGNLPLSSMVISPPSADKWRRHEAEIIPILPMTEAVAERVMQIEN